MRVLVKILNKQEPIWKRNRKLINRYELFQPGIWFCKKNDYQKTFQAPFPTKIVSKKVKGLLFASKNLEKQNKKKKHVGHTIKSFSGELELGQIGQQ